MLFFDYFCSQKNMTKYGSIKKWAYQTDYYLPVIIEDRYIIDSITKLRTNNIEEADIKEHFSILSLGCNLNTKTTRGMSIEQTPINYNAYVNFHNDKLFISIHSNMATVHRRPVPFRNIFDLKNMLNLGSR